MSAAAGRPGAAMPEWVAALTDAELERVCGAATVKRAKAYAREGMVTSIAQADRGRLLVGEVKGTLASPYHTLVTYGGDSPRGPVWVSRCNCPVGVRCKHAVAVILHARAEAVVAGRSWSDVLEDVLEPAPRASAGSGTVIDARLGLGIQVDQRPRSHVDVTPVDKVVLVPRKESRVGTWITTISWPEVSGQVPGTGVRARHSAIARRLLELSSQTSSPLIRAPQRALEVDRLGPGIWPVFTAARRAGVQLQGANPAERVELSEPADVVCDLWRADDGSARAAFSVIGLAEFETIVPIGEPVHGFYAVLRGAGESPTLVPLRATVPGWVGEMLAAGTTLEIPAAEIESFITDYLPRIEAVVDVRDLDGLRGEGEEGEDSEAVTAPEGPFVHVLLQPTAGHAVDVIATIAYRVGDEVLRFGAHTGWDAMRDYSAEEELIDRLEILDAVPGLTRPTRRGGRMLSGRATVAGADLVELMALVLPLLREAPEIIVQEGGELPAFEQAEHEPEIEVTSLDEVKDWLSLQVLVTVDGEEVPFAELFAALVRGDDIMVLPSGVWFSLDQPQLQRLLELIEASKDLTDPDRPGVMRVHRHRIADLHDLVDLSVTDLAASTWLAAAKRLTELTGADAEDSAAASAIAPPQGLRAVLRPYQQAGYAWLSHLLDAGLGGILADDMGLGKTLQTLAAVLRLKEEGRLEHPVLVVAPTSVVGTWASEAAKFTPDLRVQTIAATSRKVKQSLGDRIADADVVVTSYAVARIDAEHFTAQPWSVVVLDEAQFVKNAAAKTHQVLRKLQTERIIAITGTPMENSLMDLWAILSLAAPGLFPRADQFTKDYRKPIEAGDDAVLARLRRRVRPLMLRRSKAVVADELPEKQVQVISVVMTAAHEKIYQQHLQRERQRVLRLLAEDPDQHRVAILSSLTTLRQMALHPGLVNEDYLERTSAAKIDALIDHVRELASEGHRALVFSSFTRFLRMVQDRLHAEGLETAYLDGSTTDRQAVVEDFRGGQAPVFLISLKAGGFGLTLTEADYVFVLDPWWNPAAEEQAIDRVHRIGQDKTVFVYRFVSADTIEEKVVALQEHKRDLFAKVVDKGGSLTGKISADEIRSLLE